MPRSSVAEQAVLDAAGVYAAVRGMLRKAAGPALKPVIKKWQNTLSGEPFELEPDKERERFLTRYGILDAGQSKSQQIALTRDFVCRVARSTGEAPGVVAQWLKVFASGWNGILAEGICAHEPRCSACLLNRTCRYMDAGARDERMSGAALTKQLSRDRERSTRSSESAELLAYLMSGRKSGAGEVARAEALLTSLKGLRGVFAASAASLRKNGLDADAAARVRAAGKLFKLWSKEKAQRGMLFEGGHDFYFYYHLRLRGARKERFYVICLDQKHRLLGDEMVSEGSLTEALVHPREVFAPAIRLRAAAVAVVHNHPSGDPTPSPEDQSMTKRLQRAAQLIGIRLLDHVIVGDGRYFSFVDEGLL